MNFPVWDVGFGLPLLIAFVSIPHVFVSHFAIGGGLFLLIYEQQARRLGDNAMLAYVRCHSRFFLLTTLVFGALTGVGIWFTIGLIHPAATSSLIHTFVWFWATEWVMFVVEITASLVYYYGWDRLDAKTHRTVMWVYFFAAWGSLAVINGIITFMLTSGTWPQDRAIWPAFFNATYWPSLVARTLICFLMAGVFAFITAAWLKDRELRRRINQIATLWSLPSLVLLLGAFWWYKSALPQSVQGIVGGGWMAIKRAGDVGLWSAIFAAISIIGANILRKDGFTKYQAILTAFFVFMLFGSFEWYREAARKPYVISGYMYSNGMMVSDTTAIKQAGYIGSIKWKHGNPARHGEDIYRAACASCHSLTGYNGLASRINAKGWTEEQVVNLIPRIGYMRGAMPPWLGAPDEVVALGAFLSKEASALPKPTGERKRDAAWSANCGLCHTIDGHRPLRAAMNGLSVADEKDAVKTSGELSDAMPPFLGSEADVDQIVNYLNSEMAKTPAKGGK